MEKDSTVPNALEVGSLHWTPIYHAIEQRILHGDDLLFVISPFIKLDALKRLLKEADNPRLAKVIVRWKAEDLLSGVSDISIYPFLKELGISLYLHRRIHLKLLVFQSNFAFHGSGNVTSRGLGYGKEANVEVGSFLKLRRPDWAHIFELIGQCRLVDDVVFAAFDEFLGNYVDPGKQLPEIELPSSELDHSLLSLPASQSPRDLYKFYCEPSPSDWPNDSVRCCMHDLIIFEIPEGLAETEFTKLLGQRFRDHPFIKELVDFIKEEGPIRFGAVTNWLHSRCSDVPLPYRWEVQRNTRILYDWLESFFTEISWNIPGERSQVIRWDNDNRD